MALLVALLEHSSSLQIRLSEKWTFTLCPEVPFPSLDFLTASHVHGPISTEFVANKFRDRKNGKGSYLVRMCPDVQESFCIHYIKDDGEGTNEIMAKF